MFEFVWAVSNLLALSIWRVVLTCLLTLCSSVIVIWIIGLDRVEKEYVLNRLHSIITNKKNNRTHERS